MLLNKIYKVEVCDTILPPLFARCQDRLLQILISRITISLS